MIYYIVGLNVRLNYLVHLLAVLRVDHQRSVVVSPSREDAGAAEHKRERKHA